MYTQLTHTFVYSQTQIDTHRHTPRLTHSHPHLLHSHNHRGTHTHTHRFIHTTHTLYTHSQTLVLSLTIGSYRLTAIHTHRHTSSYSQTHIHSLSLISILTHSYRLAQPHTKIHIHRLTHFHTHAHFHSCAHSHPHSLSLLIPYTLIHTLAQSSHCHSHTSPLTLSPHSRKKKLIPSLIPREISEIFPGDPNPKVEGCFSSDGRKQKQGQGHVTALCKSAGLRGIPQTSCTHSLAYSLTP